MGKPKSVFQGYNDDYIDPLIDVIPNHLIKKYVEPEHLIHGSKKPESVFNTQEKNIVPEIVTPVSRTNKPESIFNQNEFSQNQTSISDITEDLSSQLEDFIDKIPDSPLPILDDSYLNDIFKNDETEIKNVSFEITPINFRIIDNRIKGTVLINTFFSPLDLKQNVFNQKINDLHFKSDLSETIEINETAKNYKNLSIKIHVMAEKGKVIGKEIFLDVLEGDTQDMPVKEQKDNKMMYVVGGIGLIALALIVKKMRKGDKN